MAISQRSSVTPALVPRNRLGSLTLSVCLGMALSFGGGATIWAASPPAKAPTSDVNAVIAAYLVNFVRYIEWPAGIPSAGESWRIGLLNSNGLNGTLERMVEGKSVRGRPIVIVRATNSADLQTCQVVLLPSPSIKAAEDAKAFANQPVLTVAYREKEGGEAMVAIELVLQNRNIRYRLNAGLFAAQGLRATPGLLENSLPAAATSAGISP
jgi:hypothetical protein